MVAALIEYKDSLLITKRPPKDTLRKNLWEFPGGKVEENETLKEALKREILEEFNIKIPEEIMFLSSVKHSYPDISIELYGFTVKITTEIKLENYMKLIKSTKINKKILTQADHHLLKEYIKSKHNV